MLFKKPKPVACAVCGKDIAPEESRFVEKQNRITKVLLRLMQTKDSLPGPRR
jgi:hypothetical protein